MARRRKGAKRRTSKRTSPLAHVAAKLRGVDSRLKKVERKVKLRRKKHKSVIETMRFGTI
jgi:hypothetical protein